MFACKVIKGGLENLGEVHRRISDIKKEKLLEFRSQFELARMRPTESIKQFFTRITEIFNGPRTIGEVLEEFKIVEKILQSLIPSQYTGVMEALEKNDNNEQVEDPDFEMFQNREIVKWTGGRLWHDQTEVDPEEGVIPDEMQSEEENGGDTNNEEDTNVNDAIKGKQSDGILMLTAPETTHVQVQQSVEVLNGDMPIDPGDPIDPGGTAATQIETEPIQDGLEQTDEGCDQSKNMTAGDATVDNIIPPVEGTTYRTQRFHHYLVSAGPTSSNFDASLRDCHRAQIDDQLKGAESSWS